MRVRIWSAFTLLTVFSTFVQAGEFPVHIRHDSCQLTPELEQKFDAAPMLHAVVERKRPHASVCRYAKVDTSTFVLLLIERAPGASLSAGEMRLAAAAQGYEATIKELSTGLIGGYWQEVRPTFPASLISRVVIRIKQHIVLYSGEDPHVATFAIWWKKGNVEDPVHKLEQHFTNVVPPPFVLRPTP